MIVARLIRIEAGLLLGRELQVMPKLFEGNARCLDLPPRGGAPRGDLELQLVAFPAKLKDFPLKLALLVQVTRQSQPTPCSEA